MRQAKLERKTKETEIELEINLDGQGATEIETPLPFLNHMLELFAYHGRLDFKLTAEGDTEVDGHHLTEDIGIVLGQALKEAVAEKKGINRYGNQFVPMDEALVQTTIDFGGRFYLNFSVAELAEKIGDFDTELVKEFFRAVAYNAGMNLHIRQLAGENTHHILEAVFKSYGRALAKSITQKDDVKEAMSTKGTLE